MKGSLEYDYFFLLNFIPNKIEAVASYMLGDDCAQSKKCQTQAFYARRMLSSFQWI